MSSTFQPVTAHLERERILAQSQARPAFIRFQVAVSGAGEARMTGTSALAFGAFMLEEPTMTFGAALPAGVSVPTGSMPLCTALVLAYQINENGLYYGAEMGFRVESYGTSVPVRFSVMFTGYTLRTAAFTQVAT